MSTSNLRFFPLTDVGRVREANEDSFIVDKRLNLFVVADGMGGHAAGEVASRIAVHAFRESVAAGREAIERFGEPGTAFDRNAILAIMEQAALDANTAVFTEGQRDEAKRGMGTTLIALLIIGSRGFLAHVGDSRIYLVRRGEAHQLTEDHSLINELLKRRKLTEAQIEKIQYKNAVTRAIGVYETVDVDTLDFDVVPEDRFLLCSDGLHGYVEAPEIPKFFAHGTEEEIATRLISAANERGGKDNITAIAISMSDDASGELLAAEVNLKIETLQSMPFFRFLKYQEVVRILNRMEVRAFTIGTEIVSQGQPGEELFMVLTGQVRVHKGDAIITRLGPGQHFGEMSLIENAPRSATVTADENTRLLVMRRSQFFEIMRKDKDIAVKLLWSFLGVLSNRLRETSRELGEARIAANLDDFTDDVFALPEV